MSTAEPRKGSKYELARGESIGKYEILRKIATGGMAEIYLARTRGAAGFEKVVVLKRILPGVAQDPEFVNMFLDEARLAATLQHPNIADVYDSGEADGQYFFTMEFVHGQDVRTIRHEMKKRNEPVPLSASLAIVHGTASALDYAHERRNPDGKLMGLVHRDVSASNVMVSYDGAVKLLDFGIARVISATHKTQVGTLKGKIPYMSPEQCKGLPLDRRSDLFSLGVVLFELTVGRRPFRGDSDFAVMDQIVYQGAPKPTSLVPGYPPELEAIVMKLLERDPKARYTTGDELVDELDVFIQKYGLWLSPKQLGKYMRTVFADKIKAWEDAEKHGISFTEHVADAITSGSAKSELMTPPSAFPALEPRASSPEIAASLRPTPVSMQAMQPPTAPAQLPIAEGDKEKWEPSSKSGEGWDAPTKAGEGWDAPTTQFVGEAPTASEDLEELALGAAATLRPDSDGLTPRPMSTGIPRPVAGIAGKSTPNVSPPPELPLRAPPPGSTPPVGSPVAFPPSRPIVGRSPSDTFTPPTMPDSSLAPGFVPVRSSSPGSAPPPVRSSSPGSGPPPVRSSSPGSAPPFAQAPRTPATGFARASSPERIRPPTASAFASDAPAAALGAPAFSDAVPAHTPLLESQPYPSLRPRSNRVFLIALIAALAIGAGIVAYYMAASSSTLDSPAAGSDIKTETKPLDEKPVQPVVETPKVEAPKVEAPKPEPAVATPKTEPAVETPKAPVVKQPVVKQPTHPAPSKPAKPKDSSWDPNSPFLPQ